MWGEAGLGVLLGMRVLAEMAEGAGGGTLLVDGKWLIEGWEGVSDDPGGPLRRRRRSLEERWRMLERVVAVDLSLGWGSFTVVPSSLSEWSLDDS